MRSATTKNLGNVFSNMSSSKKRSGSTPTAAASKKSKVLAMLDLSDSDDSGLDDYLTDLKKPATKTKGASKPKPKQQQPTIGGKSNASTTNTGKRGKKVVERAADADRVLQKTRELRDQLRRKREGKEAAKKEEAALEFDSDYKDADSDDSDLKQLAKKTTPAAKSTPTKVSESTIPTDIVEVSELSAEEVLDGIEAVALRIASQVLAKQGFTLDIPSRAASNQIYVQEWDRIVLGGKRMTRKFLNVSVRATDNTPLSWFQRNLVFDRDAPEG